MKGKDYGKNIDIVDAELERLQEILTNLSPESEEYSRVTEAIKRLEESKLLEHKCYTEYKDSLLPKWLVPLASVISSTGLGVMIYKGELSGKVIGSAAITMLNKIRFPL